MPYEFFDICASGGKLLLSTPCAWGLMKRLSKGDDVIFLAQSKIGSNCMAVNLLPYKASGPVLAVKREYHFIDAVYRIETRLAVASIFLYICIYIYIYGGMTGSFKQNEKASCQTMTNPMSHNHPISVIVISLLLGLGMEACK